MKCKEQILILSEILSNFTNDNSPIDRIKMTLNSIADYFSSELTMQTIIKTIHANKAEEHMTEMFNLKFLPKGQKITQNNDHSTKVYFILFGSVGVSLISNETKHNKPIEKVQPQKRISQMINPKDLSKINNNSKNDRLFTPRKSLFLTTINPRKSIFIPKTRLSNRFNIPFLITEEKQNKKISMAPIHLNSGGFFFQKLKSYSFFQKKNEYQIVVHKIFKRYYLGNRSNSLKNTFRQPFGNLKGVDQVLCSQNSFFLTSDPDSQEKKSYIGLKDSLFLVFNYQDLTQMQQICTDKIDERIKSIFRELFPFELKFQEIESISRLCEHKKAG